MPREITTFTVRHQNHSEAHGDTSRVDPNTIIHRIAQPSQLAYGMCLKVQEEPASDDTPATLTTSQDTWPTASIALHLAQRTPATPLQRSCLPQAAFQLLGTLPKPQSRYIIIILSFTYQPGDEPPVLRGPPSPGPAKVILLCHDRHQGEVHGDGATVVTVAVLLERLSH